MTRYRLTFWTTLLTLLGVGSACLAADCEQTSIGCTPLTDFLPGEMYHGETGGLYGGWSNEPPTEYAAEGDAIAHALDGQPIVLLSIGMSNMTQAWWAAQWDQPEPNPWTFAGQCVDNPLVSPDVTIVNGAAGAQTAEKWLPGSPNYQRIRDFVLAPRGLTREDVRALSVKLCNKVNDGPLPPTMPDLAADVYELHANAILVMGALVTEYPNAELVFVSTRSYAGYAGLSVPPPDVASPEPYAYESGFALRWLVMDAMSGTWADWPFVDWGPYWWGDGEEDGWTCDLYQADGIHLNTAGETKQANLLLDHFLGSEATRSWFHAQPADINDDGVVGISDLSWLLSAWGLTRDDPEWSLAHVADLDGDDVVGFGDLVWLNGVWGAY